MPFPGKAAFFDTVRERAKEMAGAEFKPRTEPRLPDALERIGYDQFQTIRFRPEMGPWHSEQLPFEVHPVHRGFIFQDPVKLHLLEGTRHERFVFSPGLFDYDNLKAAQTIGSNLDFAGFKIVRSQSSLRKRIETASFLGASYFRIVGHRQQYGASARALAIDTGEPGGEEFPRFTEFWVEKPGKTSAHLRIFALMDSPSVAGACQFVLRPGDETSIDAEISLFPRADTRKFGIAPLTSMFQMGENSTRHFPDFRPEVHDSDGLLIVADKLTLWRPLSNPEKRHRIINLPVQNLQGFGLLQRDRAFSSYEDLEARYEARPSLWVQPSSTWTAGTVELVEIPTDTEYNDNIVAYWIPGANKPAKGQEFRISYRVSALTGEPAAPNLVRVTATRIQTEHNGKLPRIVIDFSGDTLSVPTGDAPLTPVCKVSRGGTKNLVLQPNGMSGGWRVFFDLDAPGNEPVDLQLALHLGGRPISETWVYQYQQP